MFTRRGHAGITAGGVLLLLGLLAIATGLGGFVYVLATRVGKPATVPTPTPAPPRIAAPGDPLADSNTPAPSTPTAHSTSGQMDPENEPAEQPPVVSEGPTHANTDEEPDLLYETNAQSTAKEFHRAVRACRASSAHVRNVKLCVQPDPAYTAGATVTIDVQGAGATARCLERKLRSAVLPPWSHGCLNLRPE
jgi:hypothetical protein